MFAQPDWTIAIRSADGALRKITKIIGLNGGGFSLLMPYHRARSGVVCKMPVGPGGLATKVAWSNMVAFTAEDKVKLSYHTDGFAQFSGEAQGKIISGIDAKTGMPKGVGLFTNPLTAPISSGGSVAVTLWGLEDFETTKKTKRTVVFSEDDFYYRFGCMPGQANAFIVQMYAIPVRAEPPLQFKNGHAVLSINAEALNGRLSSIVQMKVLPLEKEIIWLGAYVNAYQMQFPVRSGWIVNGPGDHSPGRRGHVLTALYPRDGIKLGNAPSLDFVKAAPPTDTNKPESQV